VEVREALLPLVGLAATLSADIKEYDKKIEELGGEKYGHTALLQQGKGVGPITALAYVLTLENPQRFAKSRDVGPYLGLVPKQEDSGREPAAIRNQQSRRYDGAQAAGGKRAVYLGTVRTGHGPTTVWVAFIEAGAEDRCLSFLVLQIDVGSRRNQDCKDPINISPSWTVAQETRQSRVSADVLSVDMRVITQSFFDGLFLAAGGSAD
jgi:Transposase IS116/IS110/IS902 family